MPEKHGIKSEVSEDDAKAMKIADLEATLAVLKEELSVMRKELIDVLKESEKRDIDYARLKVSIAASLAEGNKKSYDKNGAEIMEALTEISEKGDALVANSAKFCDFIDALLEKKEISDVEKVRARFRMSKLRSTAEVFHARIQKPSKGKLFSSCRILTVNDKLQVVVLNVGSVYGMRNGVLLNGGDKGEIELKIVSVRPFISGAVVIKGDIEDLAPGMEVRNGK
jgi:regulator of replication initiation timing